MESGPQRWRPVTDPCLVAHLVCPLRYPGSQGKQYFLGLEAAFNGSGNPSYPGEPKMHAMCLVRWCRGEMGEGGGEG